MLNHFEAQGTQQPRSVKRASFHVENAPIVADFKRLVANDVLANVPKI